MALNAVAFAVALGLAGSAHAAENGNQRYAPGLGGSDMTSPLLPGWYGQVAVVAYHASKMKGNDGKDAVQAGRIRAEELAQASSSLAAAYPAGLGYRSKLDSKVDQYAILPRITYLSSKQVLGGNVGFTAMLPIVRQKVRLAGGAPTFSGPVGPAYSLLSAAVQERIADRSSEASGISDLEIAPIWHTEIGDHQHVTAAATLIIPTGDYNVHRLANSGFGNYYTFRPSVQYAFIGDGWDLGARLVLSFNGRNKANGYKTGNIMNIDYQAMKFVTEDLRLGLQGYIVQQWTKDSQDLSGFSAEDQRDLASPIDLSTGNKMRAYAAGPAIAWLRNGGEFLLEGKFLQEWGAKNRTEGQTFWLTLSKPL